MKVTQVNHGIVLWNADGTRFAFTVRYYAGSRTWEEASGFTHPSADAAKQAMREKVAQERKKLLTGE